MASMRDIKRRKASIESTQQITKAMKLVSTVKLQKAKTRAEDSKPYFNKMYDTVQSILSRSGNIDHPYLRSNGSGKKAVIVVTSNRGLAGGYNSNVVKLVESGNIAKEDAKIYGIGKKGIESLARKGYEIVSDDSEIINEPLFSDAVEIGRKVLDAYLAGEVGEIYLAYTGFKNTVVHIPKLIKLLPVEVKEDLAEGKKEEGKEAPMNYEPEAEESLDLLIPKYMNSIIYGAFIESVASENGARMQAMDAATSNAEDMIATLSVAFNRARQGAITQELTEIISGAEALN
ncbi:MAG: ATP synthase F1 subunit gamma [Eubacterium sp.]|nr:ATP synthase F1 subunit gamma [Eubacterium sp.]MDD7210616.1 ATP synthase F1 subunit gamma [Lachnospiraceae bacterium]MDY5498087.1 ATP synthase F1 subunit gamma [Anaerobutyricum sp.]